MNKRESLLYVNSVEQETFMNKWELRNRPFRLEKRFEFDTYEETREFLDRLGAHSEAVNRFPDISFGKTYVNITIRPVDDDPNASITDDDHRFASEISELIK